MPTQLRLEPYSSEILRKPLKRVSDPLAPDIQAIIADMQYSIAMPQLKKGAAGMAANQWGLEWQIFLYCPNGNENPDEVEVIVNPSYTPLNENKSEAYEGCFSIPGAIQKVSRYTDIAVEYQTPQGKWIKKELSGWDARVWQHENDHVLGILCDAKNLDTIEKVVFENTEAEKAFMERLRSERSREK
jgi:peptide deformylase